MSHHFRNEILNNRESLWIERPNLVAQGVGLQPKTEHSTAWQILQSRINVSYSKINVRIAYSPFYFSRLSYERVTNIYIFIEKIDLL